MSDEIVKRAQDKFIAAIYRRKHTMDKIHDTASRLEDLLADKEEECRVLMEENIIFRKRISVLTQQVKNSEDLLDRLIEEK